MNKKKLYGIIISCGLVLAQIMPTFAADIDVKDAVLSADSGEVAADVVEFANADDEYSGESLESLMYYISFDTGEGSLAPDEEAYSKIKGKEAVLTRKVVRDGYKFKGWKCGKNYYTSFTKGTLIKLLKKYEESGFTLTAAWTPKKYKIVYKAKSPVGIEATQTSSKLKMPKSVTKSVSASVKLACPKGKITLSDGTKLGVSGWTTYEDEAGTVSAGQYGVKNAEDNSYSVYDMASVDFSKKTIVLYPTYEYIEE